MEPPDTGLSYHPAVSAWVPPATQTLSPSCDVGVFVEEAAQPVASDDRDVGIDRLGERPERTGLVQCPMRPVPGDMGLVLGEEVAQVRGVDDEDLYGNFRRPLPAQRPVIRVRIWRPGTCASRESHPRL